ncbi:MAG: hypothetical protein P8080_00620 [Gammaproteobacteria bacterium]
MIEDLEGLNRRFLHLAKAGLPGLEEAGSRALHGLDRAGLRRLAAVPFALFSFGFGVDPRWDGLRENGVRDMDPPPATGACRERFALLALAFMRHMASQDPRRAMTVAGIPESAGRWLVALDPGLVAAVAPGAASALRWRAATRKGLWPALIGACANGDEALLAVLRPAGVQWTIRRALDLPPDHCVGRQGFRAGGR